MNTWLRQHTFALADAFKHLRHTPGSFCLNVLVVAIALALPFAGLTVLENVRPLSEQLAVEPARETEEARRRYELGMLLGRARKTNRTVSPPSDSFAAHYGSRSSTSLYSTSAWTNTTGAVSCSECRQDCESW